MYFLPYRDHAEIQEFLSGGPGPAARKQPGQRFLLFFSPQLILQFTEGVQGGPMVLYILS